uniref:AAA+ ATPase domain-containing protein n=1 Tax=Setaria viridis TaxID=4556 RepID=A0A4U6THL7_SETVI|nr:hypothetical protein SEVIR_8G207200v2 [Setaria viridis]
MELVTGVLPRLIPKLGDLLAEDYNLRKGVKGEIMVLQAELESFVGALKDISRIPPDQLDNQAKVWSRNVRDLSYDLESCIDRFMVRCKRDEPAKHHGLKKAIDGSIDWLMQPIVHHKFATRVTVIRSRVMELTTRHRRYGIGIGLYKAVPVDPRLFSQHKMATDLVGIDAARDEIIKIMVQGNETSMQRGNIVAIVGPAGLGKTTLANAVYQKLREQFDCCAFVSVSQKPDMNRLFYSIHNNPVKNFKGETLDERWFINKTREFLQDKRYLVVIDDLWDILVWEMIADALPHNNCGYRIIITTRISSIAKHVGYTYEMEPLSPRDSKILLYSRIFGSDYNEDKETCPYWDLAEVSDQILQKCAGLPLAIITIASLLDSKERDKMDWYEVYNSISTEFNRDMSLNNMAAEGFIPCEKQGDGLFELGESYFNELINRSMIIPIVNKYHGMIDHCRVYDIMLENICSLASEENFVTILNDYHHTHPSQRVRRLSLQNGKEYQITTQATRSIMQQVRSVIVFPSVVDRMPPLGSLRELCVLDLNDCDLSQGCSLKYIGNLFHLRYLGLSNTRITQLPEEVGNLQFLQTLSVTCNEIANLPSTVVRLRHLMCLRIDMDTRVPNGIASLTSLEELSQIGIYDSTDIEIIYCLTELRVLDISCHIECMDSLEKSLVECLCKLQKIQNLNIIVTSGECKLDGLVLSQKLRRLSLWGCWFSTLPAWVNSSLLVDLSFISIAVIELKEEDLEILGRLPALCYLNLKVDHENLGIIRRFIIGAIFFPCLVGCVLWGFRGPVVFHQGAMPRLTSLRFTLHARDMREISGSSEGGYDFGFQNLPSLQDVTVFFRCGGTSDKEVKEVKAALRHATTVHPNHPTIDIVGYEDKGSYINAWEMLFI